MRWIRLCTIGLLVVGVLLVLCYLAGNWRSRQAWQQYKREWEAKGERFELEALIPPPVSADKNFAAIPLWAPLFDYSFTRPVTSKDLLINTDQYARWRDPKAVKELQEITLYRQPHEIGPAEHSLTVGDWQTSKLPDLTAWQAYYRDSTNFPVSPVAQDAASDVLLALSKYDDVIKVVHEACQRPLARFPLHYQDGSLTLSPHHGVVRKVMQVLTLRASAELELGKTDQALADVMTCFRLADSLRSEPFYYSQLTRNGLVSWSIEPIWEGLGKHCWKDHELAVFQQELRAKDFLVDWQHTARYERADINERIQELQQQKLSAHDFLSMYTIWITHDDGNDVKKQLLPGERRINLYLRLCPRGCFDRMRLEVGRAFQDEILSLVSSQQQLVYAAKADQLEKQWLEQRGKRWPHDRIVGQMLCVVPKSLGIFARAQTAVNEANLACALERYRLAHDRLPDTLNALVPEFIEKIPHDVINGQPLRYRLTDDGQYVLYSVGWDGIDDGGSVKKAGNHWGWEGDWAWRYPSQK